MKARYSIRFIIIFLFSIALISCEKEEIPDLNDIHSGNHKNQLPVEAAKSISMQTVYGPEQFMLLQKKPVLISKSVYIDHYQQYLESFVMYVTNGDENQNHMVDEACISVNGVTVLEINDSNVSQQNFQIITPLQETNLLEVELKGKAVCYLTITIAGVLKPVQETPMEAIGTAEDIFRQIQPVYFCLANAGNGELPALSEGISANYRANEDSTTWSASVSFSQYASTTGYFVNGLMDLSSHATGDPSQPPHQSFYNFRFDGIFTASGKLLPELDYYRYQFHIILNSLVSWSDFPDPQSKTTITQYDFDSLYVFINNDSISPEIILDIMAK